jgi:uncharacterized LabA/DUF88 family protein
MNALFVDLPNFYSHFLESGIEEPRLLRDYFLEWFDFDRLAYDLTGEHSPVWVFHSNRRFGPRQNRIEGQYLNDFINRINSLKGVTARNVNILGKQREPTSYVCEKCQHTGIAQWESEKGIDASLTVHLFDTMESWNDAYLLSGDADFVPAVSSLRRRGKIVIGAGFPNASSALIRECYDYIDLSSFLREDVAGFKIFKQDGIFQKWILDGVEYSANPISNQSIGLTVGWGSPFGDWLEENQGIFLTASGNIDLSARNQLILDFKQKFPENVEKINSSRGEYFLRITPEASKGVQRRLENIQVTLKHLKKYKTGIGGTGYQIDYQYDADNKEYRQIQPDDMEE